MNADTTSPTPPTPAPVGGPQPIPPAPGATTPPDQHHHHHHGHAEPNALLDWSKKAWEGLKSGKVGNPRILALVLAVVAILGAWWFLARSSSQNDSALWLGFDKATSPELIKGFVDEPTQANTVAAKIAKLNDARLRKDLNLYRLTESRKLVDRQGAAESLEKLRDELTELAGQFGNDRTLKAEAYLAAAEVEMGLVGVPKKGVVTMGVDVKGNCRGQLSKYAEYMTKVAEAIGQTTDAGKGFQEKAEKYTKEPAATELYNRLGTFHAKFNDPDPVPLTPPFDPNAPKIPDSIPGDTPKAPDKIPEVTIPKLDEKKPGDAPKAPDDPFKNQKKDEKKPDEKKEEKKPDEKK